MADKSNASYGLLCGNMLEARQSSAHLQSKNYSHVFRKKSFFEILRLSAMAVGIGFVYAAETAFVSPTLLQIGVDHSTMTMVWALSPTLGLLLGPFLGSISDRCRLNLGRRKPLILLLSLAMVVGFFFVPFGRNIGQFFGDDGFKIMSVFEVNKTDSGTTITVPSTRPSLKNTIMLTIVGAMLMDFAAETSQNPTRAYMLDVCIPEDHNKVLSTFSTMVGLGCTVGYVIGGIDWSSTALGQLIGGNLQTVFMIDAFFFVMCFCITFFSFREIPLPLIEKYKLLQPLTEAKDKCLTNNLNSTKNNFLSDESLKPSMKFDDINVEEETVSLGSYMKSIVVMPKSLWILSLTNLLCWMGHVSYCIYFTDFVGEQVFHGDPTAPVTSQEYNLYLDGVRFGGLGMAIYAISCSIYSIIIEKLMIWLKPRNVFIFGIMVYAIGMFILAAWPSKLGVLLLSITAGIVYATLNTIPYIIVANYHAKGCFEICSGENIPLRKTRGLGTDIAIISSMMFIAQLIISLSVGFLVSWTGTTRAIFYASSGFSVCAAVSAIFVLYI